MHHVESGLTLLNRGLEEFHLHRSREGLHYQQNRSSLPKSIPCFPVLHTDKATNGNDSIRNIYLTLRLLITLAKIAQLSQVEKNPISPHFWIPRCVIVPHSSK